MDFVHLIADQSSKILDTSPYLEAIWAHLTRKTEYNLEAATIERRIFIQHLPLNLQMFLNDCVRKVQEVIDANSTIKFADLKIRYVKSLIYWCLVCGEEQGNLVPLTAARLYFMLNSFPHKKEHNLLFVENVYLAALSALENALTCETIPAETVSVIDELRVFLKRNNINNETVTKTVAVLNKIVNLDNQRTFSQFNTDEPSCNLQHGGLLCFKVLLVHMQENHERNKEAILLILFSLMGCFSSLQTRQRNRDTVAALQYNIKHLLKCIYKYETVAECLVLIVIKTMAVHKDFDEYRDMVSVLCDLDYSVYTNFCWWVAEGLVSNQPEFRKHLPNIVAPLITHTHGSLRQEKKDTLVEVLTLNLIKLCSDTKFDIAENALRNLEIIIFLNDSSVRNAVKNLITKDHEALLEMISKHIDKTWKHKNTNRNFVNVICKLHSFKRNILNVGTNLTKDFDEMLADATPMDLRPCMHNLAELLKCSSDQPHIANVLLRFFVRMTLSPAGVSNFYARVLYDILFQTVVQNLDSSNALNVADLLISQHYDYKEVFKKFYSLSLLITHKLQILINHKAPESSIALKLICAMLDHTDYKHFEGLADLTHKTFEQKSYQQADILFYALEKILTNLSRPIDPQDAGFLEQLLPALEHEIRIKNLPVSCSSNAIGLLLKLEKILDKNVQIHHIVTELETSIFNKLMKIEASEEVEMFEVCRDFSYMGDFLLLTEETLGERTVSLLRNVLKIDDARAMAYLTDHPDVWSLLVAFFTKLSLKHEHFVEENIFILESAFISGSETVRYHALLGLEDLCSFRLNYFQPLVPHVFKFIQDDNPNYLTIVCMRIIKRLINEDYILVDEEQYVAITSLLAHKNDYIRMKAETVLFESLVVKCKKTIGKFFVPSILYYNKYKHHPIIYISEEVVIPTLCAAQRKRIYKYLLGSMATVSQFNVINEMSNEILAKILDGHLIDCAIVLRDCVDIIGLFLQNMGEGSDSSSKKQETVLRAVVAKNKSVGVTKYHDYQMVTKRFLVRLLNVAIQIHRVDDLLRSQLIKIVMQVTTVLFAEINKIIMEGSEDLRKLYFKFLLYYEKNKDTLPNDETEIRVEERRSVAGPSTSYA